MCSPAGRLRPPPWPHHRHPDGESGPAAAALCPRHGVYAALACFDGRRLPAVVNIGSRPTVGGTHVTVEPWILDFDGDLYGRTLRLEFYTFLRPERKFDSLDELRAAILHNAEQTREFFRDR